MFKKTMKAYESKSKKTSKLVRKIEVLETLFAANAGSGEVAKDNPPTSRHHFMKRQKGF